MPVIVAVDEDVDSLADVERELTDRYSRSYEIVTASSVSDGVARLIEMDSSGEDVALVLVGLSLGPSRWSELLQRARALHPRAQRGLIIELDGWGDTETGRLILNAMARREIDYYVFRPAKAPDEVFHQAISNFLLEWGHARKISSKTVHIIGESWTGRAYQLRQVLGRYFPAILGLDREMHDGFFLELLEAYPDPRTAAAGRMPRLERILREHRIRAVTAEDLAVRLRAPALKAPNYVLDACRDEALDLVAQIKLLNAQLAAADEQLDELLERHPDRELLQSLPGIAERLSVRVVAEAGDRRDRFEDRSSFQSIAGTAPVTRRSGKRGVMSITMRKGCNRVLQAAMFNMARCSLPASGWARAFYDHARAHGMRHAAAVRALSSKWAKILWAILRDRKPYDEAAHVERLRAKGVPWAKQITGGEEAACPA